ncbi:hypothetical protein Ari01nite_90260 [Paractinoplanes rishiriensis]|uniref:Uncharacterized protein n=1 Tax=Paractinoplanes rishiriensis TaxID=1050105 RepID=A0A919KCY6_9ACTN|nr:hypothetical protein Ari01nite_90260 [Actinoplanes rishiriensis]
MGSQAVRAASKIIKIQRMRLAGASGNARQNGLEECLLRFPASAFVRHQNAGYPGASRVDLSDPAAARRTS